MANGKKRISRRIEIPAVPKAPPSVWQALNEPVVEVTPEFAKGVLGIAVAMLLAVWVLPYWGVARAEAPFVSYNSSALFEQKALPSQMSFFEVKIPNRGGMVAGVQTSATPTWYHVAKEMPNALSESFAQAANEVLDSSGPVMAMSDFYSPGFQAVSDAWLGLMMDPY